MNKYKKALKQYNEILKMQKGMKNNMFLHESDQSLYNKSIFEIICYFRLSELIKSGAIGQKKGKALNKLLDLYFELDRELLNSDNIKIHNKFIKIEAILSSYHIIDPVDLTELLKKDILKKVKSL